MSVNVVNSDGSTSKIAGGLASNDIDVLKSDLSVVETTSTASRAYTQGDCFIMASGQLVRATSDIDQGDTITLNTNVSAISIIELLSEKADKVTSAVEGNFAGLDSNGNLIDSGHKHSDYLTQHQDISGKADKVTGATNGNLAKLDANGNLADGSWSSDKTTTSATGNPISISGLKSNQLAINPIITLETVQAGSGTPSPSNVRAISGYDKIEVLSCGKNLLDCNAIQSGTVNGLNLTVYRNRYGSVEKISVSGKATATSEIIIATPLNLKNGTYILTGCPSGGSDSTYRLDYLNTSYVQSKDVGSGVSITVNDDANYVRIRWLDTTNTYSNVEFKPMIRLSSITDATYEPYHKTIDLSLTLGQTVYKGSLDVRTGLLTVTHKAIDLGDYTYTKGTQGGVYVFQATITGMKPNSFDKLCSCFKIGSDTTWSTLQNYELKPSSATEYIAIRDDDYTEPSAFKTAMAGQKLVYELATPITIQLIPHEIPLLKDYAYLSTNGISIALNYHNGEIATLGDVSQLGETVNELAQYVQPEDSVYTEYSSTETWATVLARLRGLINPNKLRKESRLSFLSRYYVCFAFDRTTNNSIFSRFQVGGSFAADTIAINSAPEYNTISINSSGNVTISNLTNNAIESNGRIELFY